ncbi:hypothetical protein WJX73_004282 [Symbiochloris irregularis]|uniref:Uncharacterized protein n=1 Tax=Symbiochloris irregularis TaxID=706552 RepID=A0AAW1NY14_9CHLO
MTRQGKRIPSAAETVQAVKSLSASETDHEKLLELQTILTSALEPTLSPDHRKDQTSQLAKHFGPLAVQLVKICLEAIATQSSSDILEGLPAWLRLLRPADAAQNCAVLLRVLLKVVELFSATQKQTSNILVACTQALCLCASFQPRQIPQVATKLSGLVHVDILADLLDKAAAAKLLQHIRGSADDAAKACGILAVAVMAQSAATGSDAHRQAAWQTDTNSPGCQQFACLWGNAASREQQSHRPLLTAAQLRWGSNCFGNAASLRGSRA